MSLTIPQSFNDKRRFASLGGVDLDDVEAIAVAKEVHIVVISGMKDGEALHHKRLMMFACEVKDRVQGAAGLI